nr:MAG TPA: hypothetical protein [Caudoviricetes sp.]
MFDAPSHRLFFCFSLSLSLSLTKVYYKKRCTAHLKMLYLLQKSLLYFKYLVNALYIAVFQKDVKTDVQYE